MKSKSEAGWGLGFSDRKDVAVSGPCDQLLVLEATHEAKANLLIRYSHWPYWCLQHGHRIDLDLPVVLKLQGWMTLTVEV